MKIKILINIFFLFVFQTRVQAQEHLGEINGNWKVIEIRKLIPGSYYETKDEYNERLSKDSTCLSSGFIINELELIALTSECEIEDCDLTNFEIRNIKIVKYSRREIDPFTKKGKVLKDDMNQILGFDWEVERIKVGYTKCPTGYGDFTMKILFINKGKIVLYNYYNAMILEKIWL